MEYALNAVSKNRRAALSSGASMLRAFSHAFFNALAAWILAQPATNALKLGSRAADCQPGSAENSAAS